VANFLKTEVREPTLMLLRFDGKSMFERLFQLVSPQTLLCSEIREQGQHKGATKQFCNRNIEKKHCRR
jgi:hypothetical protein